MNVPPFSSPSSSFPRPPSQPSFYDMTPEQQAEAGAMYMARAMQSCPAKAVMSAGAGFALGGIFGLFMSSMSYDLPESFGGRKMSDLPFRQQMKMQFSEMAKKSYSSAKNFGYIGMIFSGTECCIESLRAKTDVWNGVSAGCLTGGGLAVKSGPQAALAGCAAFAAFSGAIDLYLRRDANPPPENDFDS
ncbi:hypothetical protein CANCADRAFT_3240 [Tortispora caseinolytica NRRL Y-17796]|uniref:Mitochondrial import inner membrane translocase subunit TIM22 n=1 Tax=Tortispora caseinolytica NRRL Y-17796 TaxID=767744 RepID=A0A1E4T9Y6_9ASCO|nr:hypothetical protein CANCADRAFT_3240 [Tortispora caseinolytica NRRL Y-17796]